MHRTIMLTAVLAASACGGSGTPRADTPATFADSARTAPRATALVRDLTGAEIGTIRLSELDGRISLEGSLRGLAAGQHGLHLHAAGRCEPPFKSAGAHWNPADRTHGTENPDGPHLGDLPNIDVAGDGTATINYATTGGTLAELLDFDGAAVVVHAGPDDMRTDPAGNSGDRVACGVVMR